MAAITVGSAALDEFGTHIPNPKKAPARPKVSVIIPAFNAEPALRACLQALFASHFRSFECVVVDDGSNDASGVAIPFGARVLRTAGRCGPAVARNLGARIARSPLLLFIDSDVLVRPDTLSRIVDHFERDPELAALIGSYDETPGDPGFLSQYRNLMHAFFHSTGNRSSSTFWTGCGAIRRRVFLEHGGFDEGFRRPAIEDIELGYRLKRDSRKLALDPEVRVKHLKTWTFWGMVKTDIFDRAIPWTMLILRHGRMPNDLNLQVTQRLSVAFVFLMLFAALTGVARHGQELLIPLGAILVAALNAYWVECASRRPSIHVVLLLLGLATLTALGKLQPRTFEICVLVGVGHMMLALRSLHAFHDKTSRRVTGVIYGAYLAITTLLLAARLPLTWPALAVLTLFGSVLALNWRFYSFLALHWGKLYALAAIPFHFLYYAYSGVSFLAGMAWYVWITHIRPLLSTRRTQFTTAPSHPTAVGSRSRP